MSKNFMMVLSKLALEADGTGNGVHLCTGENTHVPTGSKMQNEANKGVKEVLSENPGYYNQKGLDPKSYSNLDVCEVYGKPRPEEELNPIERKKKRYLLDHELMHYSHLEALKKEIYGDTNTSTPKAGQEEKNLVSPARDRVNPFNKDRDR